MTVSHVQKIAFIILVCFVFQILFRKNCPLLLIYGLWGKSLFLLYVWSTAHMGYLFFVRVVVILKEVYAHFSLLNKKFNNQMISIAMKGFFEKKEKKGYSN